MRQFWWKKLFFLILKLNTKMETYQCMCMAKGIKDSYSLSNKQINKKQFPPITLKNEKYISKGSLTLSWLGVLINDTDFNNFIMANYNIILPIFIDFVCTNSYFNVIDSWEHLILYCTSHIICTQGKFLTMSNFE